MLLLPRARTPDTRFHDLRRACATLLLTKGVRVGTGEAITVPLKGSTHWGLRTGSPRGLSDLVELRRVRPVEGCLHLRLFNPVRLLTRFAYEEGSCAGLRIGADGENE
jgi:hypothetical protein